MNPSQANQTQSLARIVDIFTKKQSGVIVLPQSPSTDALAAATSLYLALLKMGKTVGIVCSSSVTSDLTGADKIKNSLSINGDTLVISLPYQEGSIDKIDYLPPQDNIFNLIVVPRSGFPKIDISQVKFSYTGGKFDFIITIDTPNLQSLGEVYTNNPNEFQGKDIINLDRHLTNGYFGTVNLVNKTISSISELIFAILRNLEVETDKDIASNLYAGIAAATNNFTSYSVNANTFETIANLLRLGAVKKTFRKPSSPNPFMAGGSFQPSRARETQPIKPIQSIEQEPTPGEKPQTPQDWLKPKIFKGGGLI